MSPSRSNNCQSTHAQEFYGFVAWTTTYLSFILYTLWALVPDKYIVRVGIEWYPNREWSLLVPAWSIVAIMTTYTLYSALAIAATPAWSDMKAITDKQAVFPLNPEDNTPYLEPGNSPELYDIPIGIVNRVLYRPTEWIEGEIEQRS